MEEENKQSGCTGHCENCNMTQRVYCAAQIGLYNQQEIAILKENQEKIVSMIESMKTPMEELQTIHGGNPSDYIEE